MVFGSLKPQLLKKQNIPQKYKYFCKYSGSHLDKCLRLNRHIEYINVVEKLKKFCDLIYSCCHLYPPKYLLQFYHSFAKSIIKYGLLIYGSAAKTSLEKIETVQHRILTAIFKTNFDSITDILLDN